MAIHGKSCPIEQAGSDAFVKAIQSGRSGSAWSERHAAERAALEVRRLRTIGA